MVRAKTVKGAKFNTTVFEQGRPKFESGKTYPIDGQTQREINRGHAEEVDMPAKEPIAEE